MIDVLKKLFDIKGRIKAKGQLVLLLDFDGVLSDFAPTPSEAKISKNAQKALIVCAKRFPIAVISGRALADVEKKVGLNNVTYSGNHGMEWQFLGKKVIGASLTLRALHAVEELKKSLSKIFIRYKGTFLEDKKLTFAIHYRKLTPRKVLAFVREVTRVASPYAKRGGFLIEHNMKTIELRPKDTWDKGKVSLFLLRKLGGGKTTLPIYIGDSLTDEDAFKALRKKGVTIRVGKRKGSAAEYYFRNRKQVDDFLYWLSRIQMAK